VLTTFVLFSYDIQWDMNADLSHARVGYNAQGNYFDNHPLSGMEFIGCSLNGNCRAIPTAPNPFNGLSLPNNQNTIIYRAVAACLNAVRDDVDLSSTIYESPAGLSAALEPCPCRRSHVSVDSGRFRVETSNENCYRTTNPLIVDFNHTQNFSVTQRCCYSGE